MLTLPPLDTIYKVLGILAASVTIVSVIAASLGGFTFLQLGQQSNNSTPLPYTITVSGANLTFSSDVGFNITYPTALTDYRSMNSSSSPLLEIYVNPNDPVDKITVASSYPYVGETFQDFITQKFYSALTLQDFNLITRGNATLGGLPAYKIVYTANEQNWDPTLNEIVQVTWIFAINNGRIYSVGYLAVLNDYNKYLPQAQGIMASFSYT